jgi:hypothetical protein
MEESMNYKEISAAVRKNSEKLASNWVKEVRNSAIMKTYQSYDDERILNRAKTVFENLAKWLDSGADSIEAERHFESIGSQRIDEGFPLTEVHYALYLNKKVFLSTIDWKEELDDNFSATTATEIMSLMNNYFDLGNFYVTKGYFNSLLEKLDDEKKFSKDDLQNIFTRGKLDFEDIGDDIFIWRPI